MASPTSPTSTLNRPPSTPKGPTWDVAHFFPEQGDWTERDYFRLGGFSNRLAELIDGVLAVLPLPSRGHQRAASRLFTALNAVAESSAKGEAFFAPYPLRVDSGRLREPDVFFISRAHAAGKREEYAEGADLVIEVISQDRNRDLVEKRRDYARAGIMEYWLVDQAERRITVLKLVDGQYVAHAVGGEGDQIASALLPEFSVDVSRILEDPS